MSHRKFDCRAPLNLPITSEMESELSEFLKRNCFEIRPIIGSSPVTAQLQTFDVNWKSFSLKIYDGLTLKKSVEQAAEVYTYEKQSYQAFITRLKKLLAVHLQLLVHCYDTGVYDREVLSKYINNLDHRSFTFDICPKLPEVLHVSVEDCDALFHLSRLLCVLSTAYQSQHSSKVILLCQSSRLIVALHVLSSLILQAEPPTNFFSFLPVMQSPSVVRSFDSIFMVFRDGDTNAAASACVNSLSDAEGNRRWKPAVILVEEAIESRFIARLRQIMNLREEKLQSSTFYPFKLSPDVSKAIECHVERLKRSYGISVVEPNGGHLTMGPIILTDVIPSTVKEFEIFNLGPVAHVLRFRTLKEAISIASYIANSRQNFVTNFSPITGDAPVLAELWSDSSSTIWQVSYNLSDSGINNIFVNSSYAERSRVIYEMFPRHSLSAPPPESIEHPDPAFLKEITNRLVLAKKAQENWFSQGLSWIQKNLQTYIRDENPLNSLQGLLSAIESPKQFLTEPDCLELISKNNIKQGSIVLARSWCLPVGPIILLIKSLDKEQKCDAIILQIVAALANGNSVVVLLDPTDLVTQLIKCISYLQSCLPKDLLQLCEFKNLKETDTLALLSCVRTSGCILPSEACDTKTKHISNAGGFDLYPLMRRAKLFWSIGGLIFSN